MRLKKIVSGGQTGADRAALDTAIELGLEHGGYCPAGRRAEDGRISDRYQLIETAGADYAERTERNVLESDGTLLVTRGRPAGGSALTAALAAKHARPFLHIDLGQARDLASCADTIREWLDAETIAVLNVAGPRASGCPDIAQDVRALLLGALASLQDDRGRVAASDMLPEL
ncbi:MAG TPA: putative molybdenum carrier protein [Kofleriaceae bacterium]|nr:putative molybdenum carrier protein [Kofleriaceae bacterium]